jgi:hypothetical protein
MKITTSIILLFWFINNSSKLCAQTDYRDAFCGNYTSTRYYSYVDTDEKLHGTTSTYTIVISKNTADSSLNITTREGLFIAKLKNHTFSLPAKRFYGNFPMIAYIFIIRQVWVLKATDTHGMHQFRIFI